MTAADVMAGRARWSVEAADCLDWLRSLPDDAADLVFTSPPYTSARTYGVGADRDSAAWVEWMRPIVVEACRVAGLVFLNVSDCVRNFVYGCGPELLAADLVRLDGLAALRPYAWVKSGPGWGDPGNGTPGSGGRYFHRNDWEPVYGFARRDRLPPRWSDPLAFGNPPKYAAGGAVRTRDVNGRRRPKAYTVPPVSNPGNVIRVRVGGGRLGHPLAHEGEAPMPLGLAERFVCWFAAPGSIVLDCFVGSGTTPHAAVLHGRRFAGCDLRESQVKLCGRRLRSVTPGLFAGGEGD